MIPPLPFMLIFKQIQGGILDFSELDFAFVCERIV